MTSFIHVWHELFSRRRIDGRLEIQTLGFSGESCEYSGFGDYAPSAIKAFNWKTKEGSW